MNPAPNFDVRYCQGLTKLNDMYTVRAACMYEYLRKRIPEPELNVSGFLITAPLILSFVGGSTYALKHSYKMYYGDNQSYYQLAADLLRVNLEWNKTMNPDVVKNLTTALKISSGPSHPMFVTSIDLARLSHRVDKESYTDNGFSDVEVGAQFYVSKWGPTSATVLPATTQEHRFRTSDPKESTSYLQQVFNGINIYKIVGLHSMSGIVGRNAAIYDRYNLATDYDHSTFSGGTAVRTGDLMVTFPDFEMSAENVINTRFTRMAEGTVGDKAVGVWSQVYVEVFRWFQNSFTPLNIPTKASIYLTGLGLGGTQAYIAAMILAAHRYTNVTYYTYGAPRAGDQRLTNLMVSIFDSGDSISATNVRYVYKDSKFWVEYDPTTTYPTNTGYAPNAALTAVESGLMFRTEFGTYANQPLYNAMGLTGSINALLPIHNRCGTLWSNLTLGRSTSIEAMYGRVVSDTWHGNVRLPINTVVDMDIFGCAYGPLPESADGPVSLTGTTTYAPRTTGLLSRVGGWVRYAAYNYTGAQRLWEINPTPKHTDTDRRMLDHSWTEDGEESDSDMSDAFQEPVQTPVQVPVVDRASSKTIAPLVSMDKDTGFVLSHIKKGTKYYKSMVVSDLDKINPIDLAWYGPLDTARGYVPYFGPLFAFRTTRDLRLLLLNDPRNIQLLVELFDYYEESNANMPRSRKKVISKVVRYEGTDYTINVKASLLLRYTVGYGLSCTEVNEFLDYWKSLTGFTKEQLPFSGEACDYYTKLKSPLQRFSIYEIDKTVFQNMCNVFKVAGSQVDGYVMKNMPSAFGVFTLDGKAPSFPREIMLCEKSGMEHDVGSPEDYINRIRRFSDEDSGSKEFTVLTLNVHYYQDSGMESIAYAIKSGSPMPDVVCLQEDLREVTNGFPVMVNFMTPEYKLVKACQGSTFKDLSYKGDGNVDYTTPESRLSNTIYIRSDITADFTHDYEFKAADYERCCSVVTIGGITIANVHLTGGGYDDELYNSLSTVKKKQVDSVVKKFRPDILCGDFNSEFDAGAALAQAQKIPAYVKATTATKKKKFMQYYNDWSNLFRDIKNPNYFYRPAYTESTVGSTSVYGGVPDWVMFRPDYLTVASVQKLAGIQRPPSGKLVAGLSDHDGVLVTFLNTPSAAPGPAKNPAEIIDSYSNANPKGLRRSPRLRNKS